MASAGMATTPVVTENKSSASRVTKEGRRLTYVLEVIQKPERARACGQGAKSSSDRRPVDPPPIVDLRIYEGDERDGNDITFAYNANFFLFATLENARPMAHGRVPQQHINQPVLTGTPVAGMAYLDRPKQAGYFIFPDLSVRHEGKYRLSFTLFEDVKDPKDADQLAANMPNAHGSVHSRCEVKSSPFNVYSAKKFPGLTESTPLSRVVADQGCRVRIRRDIRMRKRPEQGTKEWDDYEDSTADQRAARSVSPEGHTPSHKPSLPAPADAIDRSRSGSNASNASYHPAQDLRRRSSHEVPHQYPAAYPTHHLDPSAAPPPPPPPPPSQQNAPSSFVPHTLPHPSAPGSLSSQQQQQQHQHHPSQPPTPSSYNGQSPYEQSQLSSFQPGYHTPSFPPPQYGFPAPPSSANAAPGYGFMQPPNVYEAQTTRPEDYGLQQRPSEEHGRPMSTYPNMMPLSKGLPPLQPVVENATAKPEVLSPMPMSGFEGATRPPPAQYVSSVRNASQAKRSYGSTFNTQHIQEPLRAGARPNTMAPSMSGDASEGSDEDLDFEAFKMSYRRADGSRVQRTWRQSNV